MKQRTMKMPMLARMRHLVEEGFLLHCSHCWRDDGAIHGIVQYGIPVESEEFGFFTGARSEIFHGLSEEEVSAINALWTLINAPLQ